MKTYFITGTGTDIGKTFVTGVLAKHFTEQGLKTLVMKPIQTGMKNPFNGDIGKVRVAAPDIIETTQDEACQYCLEFEASPHIAAEKENVVIDFEKILEAYRRNIAKYSPDVAMLEGAGGLMVPIDRKRMTIELIKYLDFPVILVTDALLGMINHTVLSLNELNRRNIEVAGVIINNMPAHHDEIAEDNLRFISDNANLLGVVRRSEAGKMDYELFF